MKRHDYLKFLLIILVLIFMTGCGASTITTPSKPVINSFTASPLTIAAGESSTLAWSVSDATSVSINQGVGSSLALNSSASVSPTATTTYTLTATNAAGTVIATVQVVVSTSTYAAIPGVTAPVTGATPVTAITETTQYTGTVTWSPDNDPFQGSVIYTATITLRAKTGYTLTGVAADFFTVDGATTVTNAADSGVIKAVFPKTLLTVGDSYGGGKVAYILVSGDPGYDANVQHGLIAATGDQSTGIAWSNITNISVGTTGTAIGTGQANTTAIVGQAGCTSGAAKLCNDLTEGGYSDWFLPSKDELNKLYLNKETIGGFAEDAFWGSSEFNANFAWGQSFDSGYQFNYYKYYARRVRAVRAF